MPPQHHQTFAALAEERRLISQRTRDAHTAKKAQGKLGNPKLEAAATKARHGAAADPAEARRSVAPRHGRGIRPPRHQELERQALERGLGQECDGMPSGPRTARSRPIDGVTSPCRSLLAVLGLPAKLNYFVPHRVFPRNGQYRPRMSLGRIEALVSTQWAK